MLRVSVKAKKQPKEVFLEHTSERWRYPILRTFYNGPLRESGQSGGQKTLF